jgi:hypothetical protein
MIILFVGKEEIIFRLSFDVFQLPFLGRGKWKMENVKRQMENGDTLAG